MSGSSEFGEFMSGAAGAFLVLLAFSFARARGEEVGLRWLDLLLALGIALAFGAVIGSGPDPDSAEKPLTRAEAWRYHLLGWRMIGGLVVAALAGLWSGAAKRDAQTKQPQ